MGLYGGQGLNLAVRGISTNRMGLSSGQTFTLPAGWWALRPDGYSVVQQRDPITGIWWKTGGGANAGGFEYVQSDGQNYRIANQTGALVGALLTNAGTGYTSAPTVTASAGGSIWQAVVGGLVNTTITITNAGTNYTYPPVVQFSPPPAGGIQATGHSTLSGGTVASVVVDNQGGGYSTPPIITISADPREGQNGVTQGYNAAAVATLTGSGTIAGVICIDHGAGGLTSLPTFAFSGGGGASAAATGIMCWSITAVTVGTAGTGFTGPSLLSGLDAFPQTSPAYTNPAIQKALVSSRPASILLPESGGALTATGAVFYDGGIYTSTPTPLITTNGALITASGVVTFTMGGQNSTVYVQNCG
jgi:hypothetical protein